MKREDAWAVIGDLLDKNLTPRVRPYRKYKDPNSMRDGVAIVLYVPYRNEEQRETIKRVCKKHDVRYTYEATRHVPGNEMVTII